MNEAVDFSYNVSDSDGNISNVTLEVFNATSGNQLKEETLQYSSSSVSDTQVDWYSPSNAGNFTLYFTATDDQGSSSVETLDKTVEDTVPPGVTIHSPENSTYSSSNVSLSVSANESVDVWEYHLDGTGNTTFTPNKSLEDLSDGQHETAVSATDSSGNTGSESVSFSVDTTPPTSTDNWTATGFVDRTDLGYTLVKLSASDSGSGVANITYNLGNGETTVSDSTSTLNLTDSKNYTVEYYATDNNGNVESVNTAYVAVYKKDISTSDQKQDSSSTSDLDTQYVFKEKQVDILGTAKPGNVTVSSVKNINGSCSNCNTRYLSYSPFIEDFESYGTGEFTNLSEWKTIESQANASTEIVSGQFLEISGDGGYGDPHYLHHELGSRDVVGERIFSFNFSTNDTLYDKMLIISNSKYSFNPDTGVRIGLDSAGEFQAYSGASGTTTAPISTNTDYWYKAQVTVDGDEDNFSAKLFDNTGSELEQINGSFQANELKYASIYHSGPDVSTKYDNIRLGDSSRQVEFYNSTGDNISHSVSVQEKSQLASSETNLSTQSFFNETRLDASNYWANPFNQVEIISECSQQSEISIDGEPGSFIGSEAVIPCENNSFTGDYIKERELDFKPPPGELFIGEIYTGTRKLEIKNLVDVEFSSVKTNVATPNDCTPSNLTEINVSADEYRNRTAGFSCSTGSRNNDYELVQNFDVNENNDTQYWFNGSFAVNSIETENNTLVLKFNKSNLTDWSGKNSGTVNGLIDGRGKDINVRGKTDTVELVVGTNHSNSSLENGTYTSSLGYRIDSNDTTVIEDDDDGGSGGTTVIREVFGANYSWTVASATNDFQLSGYPGREFTRVLEVENTGDKQVPLNVTCRAGGDLCSHVEISETNFTLDRDGSQDVIVSGRIPASYTQEDFPVDIAFRFSDPSFDAQSDQNSGVAFVDFRFTYSPFQGALINQIYKIGEWSEIPSPTGFGNPISYPFLLLPSLLAASIFLVGEAADRAFAKRSHRNYTALFALVMFFVFYVAL